MKCWGNQRIRKVFSLVGLKNSVQLCEGTQRITGRKQVTPDRQGCGELLGNSRKQYMRLPIVSGWGFKAPPQNTKAKIDFRKLTSDTEVSGLHQKNTSSQIISSIGSEFLRDRIDFIQFPEVAQLLEWMMLFPMVLHLLFCKTETLREQSA